MFGFRVTHAQITQFKEDGFMVAEHLFDAEEMDYLLTIGKTKQGYKGNSHGYLP